MSRDASGNKTVEAVTATGTESKSAIHARFDQLLDRMHQMFNRKDRAYAGEVPLANIRSSERIGVHPSTACYIRMGDKFGRMANLIKKASLDDGGDDTILDNAFDLAVYALIFMILREEEMGVTGVWGAPDYRNPPSKDSTDGQWKGSGPTAPTTRKEVPYPIGGPTNQEIQDWAADQASQAKNQPSPSSSSSIPSNTGSTSIPTPAVESLAQFLYTSYIAQFQQRFTLEWCEIDIVTQNAWRATAVLVIHHYGLSTESNSDIVTKGGHA